MSTKVTRSLKEINAEVVKLDKSIKSVTKENRTLDRSLRLDPSSTVLLGQKTENLQKQLGLATKKVKELKDAQMRMHAQVQAGEATTEEYKKLTIEVAKAEAQVKSFSAQVKRANNVSLDNLQSGLTKVSRVATVALGAIVALGAKYAKTGDDIQSAAERYLISAEQFQRGSFIFDRAANSPEAYSKALEEIQRQMSSLERGSTRAVKAFGALGMSVDEIEGLNASEVLELVIARLKGVADEDERVTLANALLTSSGYELALVSALTADQLGALNTQFEENGYLTEEQAQDAASLQDRWEDFTQSLQRVVVELSHALMPTFDALIELLRSVLPVIKFVADAFNAIPGPLQKIVVVLLILLIALPKLIGIFKALNSVMTLVGLNPINLKIILIASAVALLITLLFKLANLLGGIFGKTYDLNVDTSALGADVTELAKGAGASIDQSMQTNSTTTNYYDYSTNTVEAHTDADVDEIASALSTKIKIGGVR